MEQEINPYRPPSREITDAEIPHDNEPASKARRFGTFIVDYVCYIFLSFVFGVVIALVFGEAGTDAIKRIPRMLLGSVLLFFYYMVFEGVWSRTPGKWAFSTIVVNEAGTRPSFGQLLGRTACRLIPFEAFSFFGNHGWHDSISKTRVVRYR